MRRCRSVILCVGLGLFAAGCPKGQTDYSKARKAETLQDYDEALDFYQKAVKADPNNANYKIRLNQTRFEASQLHVKLGLKLQEGGDLQGALAQFQRAQMIDPSSPVAAQEIKKTVAMLAEQNRATQNSGPPEEESQKFISEPPQIKPLSNAPINLRMPGADAKMVFDTIGKLAGLTVIYDQEFPARRITAELNNVTLSQALEIVSLESKAFVKPITENIIMVIPDQAQKRRDYEEEVLRTFYLANTVTPQDLTEIVTGLRQLFDLKRIQQLNSQNAIVVRATPDMLMLIQKVLDDVDKAKPEVVIQVEVLEARTDRLRNLGILPPQTFSVSINPNNGTTSATATTGTTTGTSTGIGLNQLKTLNTSDVIFSVPTATLNAVLTDADTKIIQNPELRSVDGQQAKLKIGDRIPIATGSFSSGIGVTGGVAGAGINPLVNTQFQYQDVGVNIDLTPRVHPNHDISLKTKIEVSSVTGTSTIGGISQPIISQRVVEHDIRLREGEVSILGGLIQRTDTKTLNGWPGLAKIPVIRYLFSSDSVEHQEDEVLIVMIPHIVRLPDWTRANLRGLYSGTELAVQVKRESEVTTPTQEAPKPAGQSPAGVAPAGATPTTGATPGVNPPQSQPGKLRIEPLGISLKVGESKTIAVVVDNVTDLWSIPMLIQYNPAVISIEDVQHAVSEGQHGGFLSGGTQEIAIVKSDNKEKGQLIISATRQPNTAGVNGSGTLLGIVVKGIAPGSSALQIVQQNAKDSQQRPIPLVTSEAAVQVQP
jgi:general secretion pathway protein D